jgi:aldose 1-epimerase
MFGSRPGSVALTTGILLFQAACMARTSKPADAAGSTREVFGTLPSGDTVSRFVLTNRHGIEVRIIEYGAIVQSIRTPDRTGAMGDIVLGFDDLAGYLHNTPYLGAVVGRYANRIAKGRFTLGGNRYQLATNNGPNHLHGGNRGFDKVRWAGSGVRTDSTAGVELIYRSPDGEEGYPGDLLVKVTYTLTDRDELVVSYEAAATAATPVNLSQHSYFNLTGDASRDILDHQLSIVADSITPVDSTLIPTGTFMAVAGTPFDFRNATAIGARIGDPHQQLRFGRGYDHNFVLARRAPGLELAARVIEPSSGRTLEVRTTEPGLQFYSGNFLDGSVTGKGGRVYQHRFGLCLETQHFPDSPNHPNFPSTILEPGRTLTSRTVFTFGVTR